VFSDKTFIAISIRVSFLTPAVLVFSAVNVSRAPVISNGELDVQENDENEEDENGELGEDEDDIADDDDQEEDGHCNDDEVWQKDLFPGLCFYHGLHLARSHPGFLPIGLSQSADCFL
jgi:hypothetical protein